MWILYYLWQCRKSFINNTRTCWVFWSWVEKGQCRFTANYCRNKNAYVGVEKGLQKLTVVESIKSAEQRREELATVKPAEQQDECESGAALLSCCGCAELCARMGMSQQGTLGTSQHRSGRSHQSAGWQWAYEDGDHKIQMAVKSWHLPESQLTDLRWIQKWFRPGTKTGTQMLQLGNLDLLHTCGKLCIRERKADVFFELYKSPKPRFPFNEVGGGEKNLLEERQKNRRGHKTGWRY